MIQEFDLYVCAAYSAIKGLDSTICSIEEKALSWCEKKRSDGFVAYHEGFKLGDYGFPGQMKAGMVTKEDINRKPIIIGQLTAEILDELMVALKEYKPQAPTVIPYPYTVEKDTMIETLREEAINEMNRRVALEAQFDEVYRVIKSYHKYENEAPAYLTIMNILEICKEVIDPAVLEELDNEDSES